MLEAMGFDTGIDLDRLLAVRELVHGALPNVSSTAPSPKPACQRISTRYARAGRGIGVQPTIE